MFPASSPSSSTLSPLAPPFTVDRPNSTHCLQPYCYTPPSPAEFSGKESSLAKSVDESLSWMDPSLPYSTSPFLRGGAAEGFLVYGDGYGAWNGKHVESSARQVHIGADSLAWQGENSAIPKEKARDSWDNGLSYFHPNPNLAMMNECDTSNSNSSYDRYMSQLASCSTDPIGYYPPSRSSAEVFSPASVTGSSMYFAPRNCYLSPQHGNLLYNVDDNYVDYMLDSKKRPNINHYSERKDGYAKEGVADDKTKENNGTGNSSLTTTWSSLGNELTTRKSMDYSSEVNNGFGTKQLNFTESIASSSRTNSSLKTSEVLDQPHLAVDSPCWKGASLSQQYSFGCAEMIGPHEVKESKSSDDLDQGRKYLPVTHQYLRTSTFQEKDGAPVCNVSGRHSLPLPEVSSPNMSLYGTNKRFDDVNAKGSESVEVWGEKRSHFSCVISGEMNEKDSEKDYEQGKRNVKQSGEVRTAIMSADSPLLEGEGANSITGLTETTQDKSSNLNLHADNYVRSFLVSGVVPGQVAKPIDSTDPKGKCLKAGKNTKLLVKAMHGLSEVLLSSFYDRGVELEECDHELAQLVIDNLKTFTWRKKGIANHSSHASGNEPGQFQVSVSKSNDVLNKKTDATTEDKEGKFCYTGSCMNSVKFDNRISNGKPQVSVKDLENDIFVKREDNPQAVLYKDLWMQAEAALCSMKYELQVARMKLEMENYECQTKAKEPVQATKSPRLNFMQGFDASMFLAQESLCEDASHPGENFAGKSSKGKLKDQKIDKDDDIDASVMARLQLLKDRYARSNNIRTEEHPKCSDIENSLENLPTKLADLGFVESGIPKPFDEDGNTDGHSPVLEHMPTDMQHLALNFNEQNNAFPPEISEHAIVHTADGPLYQPFIPSVGNHENPMRFILG